MQATSSLPPASHNDIANLNSMSVKTLTGIKRVVGDKSDYNSNQFGLFTCV